jgi:hypothetical protein
MDNQQRSDISLITYNTQLYAYKLISNVQRLVRPI